MTPERDPLLDEPELVDLHDQLVAAAARRTAARAADEAAPNDPAPEAEPDTPAPGSAIPIARGRRRANRRPLLIAAAAAVMAVVASIVLSIAVSSPDVAADVTVQRRGDRVRVVLESTVTPEDVRAAMEREGLDAVVETQVTGPSQQHRFLGNLSPAGTVTVDEAGAIAEFEVGARVRLFLGVEGAPGELYDVQTDATGPGEVLDGIPVLRRPIAEVIPVLDGLPSVTVRYQALGGQVATTPPAEGIVDRVVAIADDSILVIVS